MSATPTSNTSPEKRRQVILAVIAVVCLAGAVAGYTMLSRPASDPAADQAAARAQEIEKSVNDAAGQPPPPDIPNRAPRGATKPAG